MSGSPTKTTSIYRSSDAGVTWAAVPGQPSGFLPHHAVLGSTGQLYVSSSRVVWAPAGTTPWFSTNHGSSWTASTGAPAGAIVAADRVNAMKFYALAGGAFFVSSHGGASFTRTASGLPSPARIKAVAGREGDVWLAGGTEGGLYGIWHSTNSGASFTRLASVQEADNIGMGRPAPGQSYPALYTSAQIGGVRGLYRSDDAGASWLRINDAAHQFGATTGPITGDPRVFGRVYVGTNGRGIIVGQPAATATRPTPRPAARR